MAYQPSQSQLSGPAVAPIKFWAIVGMLVILSHATTLIGWVNGPYFTPSPVGLDPIPGVTLTLIRVVEVICGLLSIGFIFYFLIRPWIRERTLSWDGMLVISLATMWVLDPICNYFNFSFMYNAYFINMGSWTMHLPGWQAPRQGNLPEPIFLMSGIYIWWTTINVLAFCWMLRKLRVWLPRLSLLGHVPIAFVGLVFLDVILELPAIRYGLFAYPGAPYSLTLWAGEYYQFPIYEAIFMNFNYTAIGLLRYYRNDKGESFIERGVGTLRTNNAIKKSLRLVALIGFCNFSYFVVYFMPYNWMALQADTFPEYPSYMRVDICGEGTPYACPSREVPIPSRESLAIPPDDQRLSDTARQN